MDRGGGEFGIMISMTSIATQPHETPQPHRFTRETYYQMAEMGFFEGHHVELIEGEIIYMAPMRDLHAVEMGIVAQSLTKAFPDHWVRNQLPLSFISNTEPEPDFAVVAGSPRDYKGKGHPTTALHVVELSDTSLGYDKGQKASLYARAGIQEYWIVNLVDNCVEVMRDPEPNASAAYGYKYRTVFTCRQPDTLSPLARPAASISVADLLP